VKALRAQTRAEVVMTLRRGETLLLTIGIPVLLLGALNVVKLTSTPLASRINFLAPGVIALCVMSTSLVALSIATGFERTYGVLRRLHVTPLGRGRMIAAKMLSVGLVETLQVLVISALALALAWRPDTTAVGMAVSVLALILATAGFAGIGLALAGSLRAEVNLATANGLYLVLLLSSGLVIPLSSLPAGLARVAVVTPAGALAEILHGALAHHGQISVAAMVSLTLCGRRSAAAGRQDLPLRRQPRLTQSREPGAQVAVGDGAKDDVGDCAVAVHEDRLGQRLKAEGVRGQRTVTIENGRPREVRRSREAPGRRELIVGVDAENLDRPEILQPEPLCDAG
jgi:ABC-2 type transport system permease protein